MFGCGKQSSGGLGASGSGLTRRGLAGSVKFVAFNQRGGRGGFDLRVLLYE